MKQIISHMDYLTLDYSQLCRRYDDGTIYGIAPGKRCISGSPVTIIEKESLSLESEVRKAKSRGIDIDKIKQVLKDAELKHKNLNSLRAKEEISRRLNLLEPEPLNYRDLIYLGKERIKSTLKDLDGKLSRVSGLISHLYRLRGLEEDDIKSREFLSYQNKKKSFLTANRLMDELRSSLIKNPSNTVEDVDISSELDTKRVRSILQTLNQLTNGKVHSLRSITVSKGRPFSSPETGEINVGNTSGKSLERALWHEFGHHLEYSSEKYGQVSHQWIKSRATGLPLSLNTITKSNRYRDSDIAYSGSYGLGPFVGRSYSPLRTEAVSSGFERFSNSSTMVDFFTKDPEHFSLILGILESLWLTTVEMSKVGSNTRLYLKFSS